jgi:hypothetical protein
MPNETSLGFTRCTREQCSSVVLPHGTARSDYSPACFLRCFRQLSNAAPAGSFGFVAAERAFAVAGDQISLCLHFVPTWCIKRSRFESSWPYFFDVLKAVLPATVSSVVVLGRVIDCPAPARPRHQSAQVSARIQVGRILGTAKLNCRHCGDDCASLKLVPSRPVDADSVWSNDVMYAASCGV